MRVSKPRAKLRDIDAEWVDSVDSTLRGQFSVAENWRAPLTFRWSAATPAPVDAGTKQRPLSVIILAAQAAPVAGVQVPDTTFSNLSCSWTWNAGQLHIVSVPALDDSTIYTLTVLVVVT